MENHMEQYLMNVDADKWKGDMDEMYAQYLDAICNTIKENMGLLFAHLDHGEFMSTMQTITKEVMTHGQQNPDIEPG